ncbi:hypothetical protein HALLA_07335 [Halostagnicola larsenii XH-48]|uniref:DUF502 domain-containing protein n=1 Tax=Halostagnicola larsenii XH-48 TaxID=797299 RepID=W0JN06_9EURY|nr:hypothetical protein HALLA_07335 [Halostagnicola larsenii XH-48]
MASWKRDFASGLVVLGPILITLYAIYWVYGLISGFVPELILEAEALEWLIGGTSAEAEETRKQLARLLRVLVVLTVFTILTFSVGYLMRTTVGGLFERIVDDIANRVPVLRVVYNASKMAAETAFGEQDSLQKPVKLETWEGLRMTAFKTGKETDDGRVVLFLPTSPNITTGFVVEVEPEQIDELDEDVEDALTRVLSAGFGDAEKDRRMDAGVPIDVVDERVSEMKASVNEQTSEVKESVSEQTAEVKETVSEQATEVKETVSEQTSEVKETVSEQATEVKETVNDREGTGSDAIGEEQSDAVDGDGTPEKND